MDEGKHKYDAFEKIFNTYYNGLLLNALKILNNRDDAEEIVQDVFVKLWSHFDKTKYKGNLKGYLYAAVKNSCLNYLKHKSIESKYQEEVKQNEMTVNYREVLNSAENKELLDAIEKAINTLPEKWKEVFLLSRTNNLTYKEIAEKLQISQKTVEKYISESLRTLRRQLSDYLPLILFLFF